MGKRKNPRPGDEYEIGSRVFYRMPGGTHEAMVVEDLGDLGVNGRRLLMIQPTSEYSEGPFMWPAEELVLDATHTETLRASGTRAPRARRNGIRIGSRVVYQTPHARIEGEVIEDRGNVGWKGRHLYRIRTFDDYEDARLTLEVPAANLTLAE
ncbi:MAG TPA: hypothetical protein VF705_14830 [Longimicrobium sp.]|jgi:hypothetical protein